MGYGEITASKALALHFLCGVGLAAGYGIARLGCDVSLVADPARTLRLLLVRHNHPFLSLLVSPVEANGMVYGPILDLVSFAGGRRTGYHRNLWLGSSRSRALLCNLIH